jgi:hypothetical protein
MVAATLDPGIDALLSSDEPLIRYRALVDLVGTPEDDRRVAGARASVAEGSIVRALLTDWPGRHPYSKWVGAHWRLVSLMDLGAPRDLPGVEEGLASVLRWLTGRGSSPRRRKVQVIDGRSRVCASQDGNGLAVAVHFGLADDPRAACLAEALLDWQWPDGGWNCDRRGGASHASVNESWPALRGLAALAAATNDRTLAKASRAGAARAAEFFLRHRVGWSETTGTPIHPVVVRLHYPPYWHYDVLAGLRTLMESGHLGDPRTRDALDLVESRRRPDGRWAPDAAHYKRPGKAGSLVEVVDWTDGSKGAASDGLTLSVLRVLKAAGRLG